MPKLMLLFIIPFISSALAFFYPSASAKKVRLFAIATGLLPLFILLLFGVNHWVGDHIHYAWFPSLSIDFDLGVDALSLLFLLLTALIIPISLLAAPVNDTPSPKMIYGLVLLLQGLLIGFFTSRDLVLFTIFWEAMLFPIYFMMILWGKQHRRKAAFKFLMYMIAGSSLMIAGVLALYLSSMSEGEGTFNLDQLSSFASRVPHAFWICGVFILAFSVKAPLFPFHGWLPDTYYEASTTGTILLSSLLSKGGIYGFLRIGLGLFPDIIKEWSPWLLGLSIAGVLYGGLAAWAQSDYKRLIAYSSFSHVNFILVGIFAWSQISHEGAILQAINHGITIAGLFLVAGWLEERLNSTKIGPFSGLAKLLPHLCWLTMIFVLSSVALPGTNNFIGELLILFGLFGEYPWMTCVLGFSIIISVMYMLRWMQKVYFGKPNDYFREDMRDIKVKELLIALPLVMLIFWIGIYPSPVLKQVVSAAKKNISNVNKGES